MPLIETKVCPSCGTRKKVEVTMEELEAFRGGELIQKAFPNMSADDRERFISGYCGICWDALFPEEK